MTVVLDADVLIGALDAYDPHHAESRALFTAWEDQGVVRIISAVNLSEVLVAPAAEPRRLRSARAAMAALGVSVHRPTEAVAIEAARLRGRHPVSLPDAYCLATGRVTRGSVASFDSKVLRAARAEGLAIAEA